MPAPLKITLTSAENETLKELSVAPSVPKRTRQRANILRLNAIGWSIAKIANHMALAPKTIREAIHRWENKGLRGLWDLHRTGRKPRWNQEDWQEMKTWLQEPVGYTAKQIAQRLKEERRISLGSEQVRRILKKKKWSWKRIRRKPPLLKDERKFNAKKQDLEMLKKWAAMGLITLMYLDESGFCSESPLVYAYSEKGKQKAVVQNRRKGKRINVLGVWEPKEKLEYSLVGRSINTDIYLQFMEQQANRAAQRLFQTGKLTVIVHDNASIHKASWAKKRHEYWEKLGLSIFFLPTYSPQMNRIEDQWLHLKRDELQGRVFQDEYDLVLAIIAGMENRGKQNNYEVERFIFN